MAARSDVQYRLVSIRETPVLIQLNRATPSRCWPCTRGDMGQKRQIGVSAVGEERSWRMTLSTWTTTTEKARFVSKRSNVVKYKMRPVVSHARPSAVLVSELGKEVLLCRSTHVSKESILVEVSHSMENQLHHLVYRLCRADRTMLHYTRLIPVVRISRGGAS